MQAKTITVVIDEDGNSTIDLTGFGDNSCAYRKSHLSPEAVPNA